MSEEQKKGCPEWQKRANKSYYEKNKERLRAESRERMRAKRLADPDAVKASTQRYRDENRTRVREWHRRDWVRRKFGIEVEEYDALLVSQNNRCAICELDLDSTTKALDHCHRTGKLRGFLCKRCNAALGLWGDDQILIKKAAAYLRYWNKQERNDE